MHETLQKESPDRCHFCSLRDTYPRHISVLNVTASTMEVGCYCSTLTSYVCYVCATGHTHLYSIQADHFCMNHVAQVLQQAHVTDEYHKTTWVGG